MIVNEDCLHTLAELTIDRLIADGVQSAWSGNYQINLLKGNIDILIDVKLKETDSHGVSLYLIYKDKTHLTTVKIKDCRMFDRAHMKMEYTQWREETTSMLVRIYSRWLTNEFILNDEHIKIWFDQLRTRNIPATIMISGFLFKANACANAAWFQVEEGKVTVYRIERSNYLNMTTEQGWQSFGVTGIRSELLRVISTLLITRSDFKFPVSL